MIIIIIIYIYIYIYVWAARVLMFWHCARSIALPAFRFAISATTPCREKYGFRFNGRADTNNITTYNTFKANDDIPNDSNTYENYNSALRFRGRAKVLTLLLGERAAGCCMDIILMIIIIIIIIILVTIMIIIITDS